MTIVPGNTMGTETPSSKRKGRKKKKKTRQKRDSSVFSVRRNTNFAQLSAVMSANSATKVAIINQLNAGTCNSPRKTWSFTQSTRRGGCCYWRTFILLPFKHCNYIAFDIKRLKSRRDLTYTSCQAQYEHDNEMNFESETKHHLNT